MLKKIKNIMFYSSVDPNSFSRVKKKVYKANLTMTTILSSFATILITIMFLTSFNSEGVKQNKNVYLIGIVTSVFILLASLTFAKRNFRFVSWLIFLSHFVYYMYGILIGTVTDASHKTVTFIVFLVFMPIIFIVPPANTIASTFFYTVIFIILCKINKEGAVLSVDIIDAVIFGILGSVSGSIINCMKMRGYTFEQKLQEISRIDQLTQTRNRNAYEIERDSIVDVCKTSLACIYIDVNELHEINNEKGHDYGDKMLCFVASEIKFAFSEVMTYRIGGDEFISFVPDITQEKLEEMIEKIKNNVEEQNYHIAIGYEISKVHHMQLDNLIKTAEAKMFCDKKRYYKNIANREIRNKIDM